MVAPVCQECKGMTAGDRWRVRLIQRGVGTTQSLPPSLPALRACSSPSDRHLTQGFALTCCSYARSDVVIRSIEEDELVGAQFSDRI